MCNFCNCEDGEKTSRDIISRNISLGVLGSCKVELGLYNNGGKYSIGLMMLPHYAVDKAINYCPMCGRKLTN